MLNKVTIKPMNYSTSPTADFDGQHQPLKEARNQIADLQMLVNVLVSSYGELKLETEMIRQNLASITQSLEVKLNAGKDRPQYLTTAEVSKRTGYTSCTILKFVKEGKISPTGCAGKYKKFHIGNICEERFRDIWASDRYWEVMNYLASPEFNAQKMCGSLCLQHKVNEALDQIVKGKEDLLPATGQVQHGNFI